MVVHMALVRLFCTKRVRALPRCICAVCICKVLAKQAEYGEVQGVTRIFERIDADGNGLCLVAGQPFCCEACVLKGKFVCALLCHAEGNQAGCAHGSGHVSVHIRNRWRAWRGASAGLITLSELQAAAEANADDELGLTLKAMCEELRTADFNHDGKISYTECVGTKTEGVEPTMLSLTPAFQS